MSNYINKFISKEEYLFIRSIGNTYEGYVIGIGYAYRQAGIITPAHRCLNDPPRFVQQGQDCYQLNMMQCIDSSPDAVIRSLRITPEDILTKICVENSDGTNTIYLGGGQYFNVSKKCSVINVTITDGQDGLIVEIKVANSITGDSRQVKFMLRDFPILFDKGIGNTIATIADWSNNAIGGTCKGMEKLKGSFRLTDGEMNGSRLSLKYYESNWQGGSRARITTYNSAKLGVRLGYGSLLVSAGLGWYNISDAYNNKDNGSVGYNTQVAIGQTVGGIGGAMIGAEIGAFVGVWFCGVGSIPGALIGGLIGSMVVGWQGANAGEAVVESYHYYNDK